MASEHDEIKERVALANRVLAHAGLASGVLASLVGPGVSRIALLWAGDVSAQQGQLRGICPRPRRGGHCLVRRAG